LKAKRTKTVSLLKPSSVTRFIEMRAPFSLILPSQTSRDGLSPAKKTCSQVKSLRRAFLYKFHLKLDLGLVAGLFGLLQLPRLFNPLLAGRRTPDRTISPPFLFKFSRIQKDNQIDCGESVR